MRALDDLINIFVSIQSSFRGLKTIRKRPAKQISSLHIWPRSALKGRLILKLKKFCISSVLLFSVDFARANIGYDIFDRDPSAVTGMPDWLIFILLLIIVLMVSGKIK